MSSDFDRLGDEHSPFLRSLDELPGSYEGPDGERREPYGLTAFGEAAGLPAILRSWIDAPLVVSGTQFLISSGFDFGELGPLKISSEITEADVITLGFNAHEPSLHVPMGPLSLYTYACYLGHATGHHDEVAQIDAAMRGVAERCRPQAPTEINPAKALAWTLWNRVPLLLAPRQHAGLPQLVQRVFARVGKSLAIALGEHPLELVSSALEGNHAFGDDLVALLLGSDDAELALASEVLSTRVAQVERLELQGLVAEPPRDPAAAAVVLWYLSAWVAAYLAILHEQDPAESEVYLAVSRAAHGG